MQHSQKRYNAHSTLPIFTSPFVNSSSASSHRKIHIQNLHSILLLSLQRGDFGRAARAWKILVKCKEVDWRKIWAVGEGLVRKLDQLEGGRKGEEGEAYLRGLLRIATDEDKVPLLTNLTVHLISNEKYTSALDNLELYLLSFPYTQSAGLHSYAGMIELFLATQGDALHQGRFKAAKNYLNQALSIAPEEAKFHYQSLLALADEVQSWDNDGVADSDDDNEGRAGRDSSESDVEMT